MAELGAGLRGAGDFGTDDTVKVKSATEMKSARFLKSFQPLVPKLMICGENPNIVVYFIPSSTDVIYGIPPMELALEGLVW